MIERKTLSRNINFVWVVVLAYSYCKMVIIRVVTRFDCATCPNSCNKIAVSSFSEALIIPPGFKMVSSISIVQISFFFHKASIVSAEVFPEAIAESILSMVDCSGKILIIKIGLLGVFSTTVTRNVSPLAARSSRSIICNAVFDMGSSFRKLNAFSIVVKLFDLKFFNSTFVMPPFLSLTILSKY